MIRRRKNSALWRVIILGVILLLFFLCSDRGTIDHVGNDITITTAGTEKCEVIEKRLTLSTSMDANITNSKSRGLSNANHNYGNSAIIEACVWTFGDIPGVVRGLLAFDLTTIPAGAYISSAQLTLYGAGHRSDAQRSEPVYKSNAAFFRRVVTPWDEKTVTWNNQPQTTTKGAIALEQSHAKFQNYIIDIRTLVQGWVDSDFPNYGLMLRLQREEYYARLRFASKESKMISKPPCLKITYLHPK